MWGEERSGRRRRIRSRRRGTKRRRKRRRRRRRGGGEERSVKIREPLSEVWELYQRTTLRGSGKQLYLK